MKQSTKTLIAVLLLVITMLSIYLWQHSPYDTHSYTDSKPDSMAIWRSTDVFDTVIRHDTIWMYPTAVDSLKWEIKRLTKQLQHCENDKNYRVLTVFK